MMGGDAARPLVDAIIAAKKQYDENDRPWLSKLADGQLKKIAANCGCTAAEGDPAASAANAAQPAADASAAAPAAPATPPTPVAAAAAPAAAPAPEKLTAEQWIEQTPEHLRGVFGDLLAQRRAKETELRAQIVSQSGGKLTDQHLASKPLDELETLAAALRAAADKPDYSARGLQAGDPIVQSGSRPTAPRMPGIKIGTGAAA